MNKSKILFLIVGKGNPKSADYPESYYRLLRKAVDSSNAGIIILLPSGSSMGNAEQIKREYEATRQVFIESLTERSMEFDADKCYEFFEQKFQILFQKGFSAEDFIIDFTHGTKAMSAALYAIGMRYRVSDFHYIQRNSDKEGNLTDGETVRNFDASYARGLSVLDQCKTLFKTWQFSAATSLLSIEKPTTKLKGVFDNVKMLADFYSAWDRLDYEKASEIYPEFEMPSFGFTTPPAVKKWIRALAKPIAEPDEKMHEVLPKIKLDENAETVLNMMFDLYANGLRRLDAGQYEDAAIRAYRIAEMMGQFYLFRSGYISNRMSSSDPKVRAFAENSRLRKKENSDIYPPFGRKQVIDFLEYIKHSKADFLRSIDAKIADMRNNSILIHGYASRVKSVNELRNIFELLAQQMKPLTEDDGHSKLDTALFMNNFKDRK
ncbi:MAG: hypothetical protein IJY17_05130 [Alphaproteobacteria bacterium]|nr:hypothetical protein [Alphaproteobacteria bacterium]